MTSITLTASETLTTAEAAELLGVHSSTVRRLAASGALPAVRLTPRSPRRYRVGDLMRLLEASERAAA